MEFSFGRMPEKDISCRAEGARMETALRMLVNSLEDCFVVWASDIFSAREEAADAAGTVFDSWNAGDNVTIALRYCRAWSVDTLLEFRSSSSGSKRSCSISSWGQADSAAK